MTLVPFPQLETGQPYSEDAEREVLGCIFENKVAYERALKELTVTDFFKDAHRLIFSSIARIIESGGAATYTSVINELHNTGKLAQAGGKAFVTGLDDHNMDVARTEMHARIVHEKAIQRRMIALSYSMAERTASGESTENVAAEIADQLAQLKPAKQENLIVTMAAISAELEAAYLRGGDDKGFSTGWPSVDQFYTIEKGAWTLITGIPGHGKSGWLDHLTVNLARKHDWRIMMFSAENFPTHRHVKDIIEKFVSLPFNEGPTTRMRPGDLSRGTTFINQHYTIMNPLAEGVTVDRILAAASEECEKRGAIDVLTIDPWNEVQHNIPEGLTETQYISAQLGKVRRWARKYDAHVFIVAHPKLLQKNRETGKYDVPTPYDVAGGAHWRNKADYCLTIYRDMVEGDDDPAVSVFVQKARRREIGHQGRAILNYQKVTGEYIDPTAARRLPEWND